MQEILYSQKFKEEKKEEYLKLHREFSLPLLRAFRDAGIEHCVSWYDGSKTYLYFRVDDFEKAIEKLSKNKVFQEMIAKVSPLLDVIQDYSGDGKIKTFTKFFDLNEQIKQAEKVK